jgi:hypothetical protein
MARHFTNHPSTTHASFNTRETKFWVISNNSLQVAPTSKEHSSHRFIRYAFYKSINAQLFISDPLLFNTEPQVQQNRGHCHCELTTSSALQDTVPHKFRTEYCRKGGDKGHYAAISVFHFKLNTVYH